jgi:hypothetical protein
MTSSFPSDKKAGTDAFADPSFDDAMIEATPVGDYNMDVTIGGKQRATTPLSAADLKDAQLSSAAASAIHTQDTLQMRVGHDSNDNAREPILSVDKPVSSSRAFAADDALLDLGDSEPQFAAGGEDEFVLDIWDDAPAPVSSSLVAPAENPVVEYQGDVTEAFETAPLVEVTPEPETVSVDPEADTSLSSSTHAGMISLEQVSPEVIDAIARRAVEQLSEKVVEQIAWEVVPELAERLIKRRLDEQRRQ